MRRFRNLFCLGLSLSTCLAAAEGPHRVVIEVNLAGNLPYGTILNNAENLQKAFAPETVQVEIVCHGLGVGLLLRNSSLSARVAALSKKGIAFMACANTLRGRHIAKATLQSFVHVVPSGVGELVRRQEDGWSYLKGGF